MALSRREMLAMLAVTPRAFAQSSQLPLKTSGLEHVGFTVPDPRRSASFYGRIFDPQIFQEIMPPLRYYCRVGTGYLAFGGAVAGAPARMDHICALVEDYRLEDMRAELKAAGINLAGAAGYNSVTDTDGLRLQFMATPGGLLPTIIASTRVTQDDAVCHAIGLDHIMLGAPDPEKSADFYRRFLGKETGRDRNPDRIWFTLARTRLGLEKLPAGQMPRVDHFGLRIAGFDQKTITERLNKLGVEILPSTDEKLLRFRDSDGFAVELRPGT